MTASVIALDIETLHSSARPAPTWASGLLVVNGAALGLTGLLAALFDLAGHFLNLGPLAGALYQQPNAIGFFEAHGLALVVGLLLVIGRRSETATWHWVAAATHLLLGAANLMFWPVFAASGLVPMGIVTTAAHGLFLVLELGAAFARSPDILSGPGALFRVLTLGTLGTGAILHGTSLPMGREAFIQQIFTPTFDVIFAIPMTLAGILGWLLYRRAVFHAAWERVVYIAMLLYFTLSIFIHLRTLLTWDTSYILAFPSWYSLPIFVVFGALTVFTIRQQFRPRGEAS